MNEREQVLSNGHNFTLVDIPVEKNEINGQNPKKVQESAFDQYIVEGVSGRIQEQEQNKTETLEKQGKKVQEVKVAEQDDTAR